MTSPSNAGGKGKHPSASRTSAAGANPPSGRFGGGTPPRFLSASTTTSRSSNKARDTPPPPKTLERAAMVEKSPDSSGTASPTDFRAVVGDLRPLPRNPVEPKLVARKDPRSRSEAAVQPPHAKTVLRGIPTSWGRAPRGFAGSRQVQNPQDTEELRTCRQDLYAAQLRSENAEAKLDILRAQVTEVARERDVAREREAKTRERVLELESKMAKLNKGLDCPTPSSQDVTLPEQEGRRERTGSLNLGHPKKDDVSVSDTWFSAHYEAFLHYRRIADKMKEEPRLPELFSQWEKEKMRDFLVVVEGWKEHLDGSPSSVTVLTNPDDPNNHFFLDELPRAMAADKKGLEKRFRRWIVYWKFRWVPGGIVKAKMDTSSSDTNAGDR